jgi:hypothetical protein
MSMFLREVCSPDGAIAKSGITSGFSHCTSLHAGYEFAIRAFT